jgi:peptidoglycan/LPS O-acetylase OafA/YrhL
LSRFLAHPVVVLLGKRSYAMYLVHVLFLDATEKLARSLHLEVWYVVVPLTYLLSFGGATALFYFVERPCINRGRRLSKAMRGSLQGTGNLRNHMVEQGIPVIERQDEGTSRAY